MITVATAGVEIRPVGGQQFGQRLRSQVGGSLGGVGKKMGLALAGGIAVGVGAILKTGLGEAFDQAKVGAQTAAAIKSTGGAAGVSAKQVEQLASDLQKMSGVADDSIQSASNLILTFTRIKGDQFTEATKAALDMSVAMKTDVRSASLLVGKALNDPIKGVTALTRAGVQFTAKQKATIAALVKTGDVAGAQKIVLAELQTQFGGSAKAAGETLPGKLAKLRRAFEDVSERAVGKLLPLLTKLAEVGIDVIDFIERNSRVLVPLVAVLGSFAAIIFTITKAAKAYTAVQAALNIVMSLNPIGLVVLAIAALVAGFILVYKKSEQFREGLAILGRAGVTVKDALVGAFRFLVDKVLAAFEFIITGAAGAFGWVPGLGPKLKDAAKAFERFRDDVNVALGGVKPIDLADLIIDSRGFERPRGFVGPTFAETTPEGRAAAAARVAVTNVTLQVDGEVLGRVVDKRIAQAAGA